MTASIVIRPETPADVAGIAAVNRAAFETADEARLVDTLRAETRPFISLVADYYGTVCGHILFTPVTLPGFSEAKFLGLAPRFNDLSAENGGNILTGGGAGSTNTSVWLVLWGDMTCHGVFPKGSPTGLQHKDLGEDTLVDAAGGKYQGYRAHYKWDAGLTLKDWRFVVRIANIDVANLTKNASGSSADLIDLFTQALETVENLKMGRPVFYCNKTIRSFLRRQITNKSNVNLTLDNVAGKMQLMFDDVPIKRCDAILNTEATVS